MNWPELTDRWVFDGVALVIMACLARTTWHINRTQRNIRRQVAVLGQMQGELQGELWRALAAAELAAPEEEEEGEGEPR